MNSRWTSPVRPRSTGVSTDVTYDVSLTGDAPQQRLNDLVAHVDAIAEIPNSLRRGTTVRLGTVRASAAPAA